MKPSPRPRCGRLRLCGGAGAIPIAVPVRLLLDELHSKGSESLTHAWGHPGVVDVSVASDARRMGARGLALADVAGLLLQLVEDHPDDALSGKM